MSDPTCLKCKAHPAACTCAATAQRAQMDATMRQHLRPPNEMLDIWLDEPMLKSIGVDEGPRNREMFSVDPAVFAAVRLAFTEGYKRGVKATVAGVVASAAVRPDLPEATTVEA